MKNNCIFCAIAAGEIPSFKVYEDDLVLAYLDINPFSKGHTLVIPKVHSEGLLDTPDATLAEVITRVKKVAAKLKSTLACDGFNLLQNNGEAAGQTVKHLHFHIVPRYGIEPIAFESHPGDMDALKALAGSLAMPTMTVDELVEELRAGARVALMVRHAERPKMDPDDPTFGDQLELTEEGKRTAKKLGSYFKEFADEVQFYASPLTRTVMTAEGIAEGMGILKATVPTDARLGNSSFYYDDVAEVLNVFRPENFFPASIEYFHTAHQRGFRELYSATDDLERWIDEKWGKRLFLISTHDLFIAAFLYARKVGDFSRENWPRFLDGGAIIVRPDGTRRYALVRTGLSTGIVGVQR